jgi:hypothetical protein
MTYKGIAYKVLAVNHEGNCPLGKPRNIYQGV